MKDQRSVVALGLAAAAAGARVGASELWIVDAVGGGDFSTIQEAVDGAASGDVILVHSGFYARFVIDGKGVSVVAEPGGGVFVEGGIYVGGGAVEVRNVPAGQSVLVRGLVVSGTSPEPFSFASPTLRVRDCAGVVALENLEIHPSFNGSGGGACVEGSAQVRIAGCSSTGGLPYAFAFIESQSRPGLSVESSSAAIFNSEFRGGVGSSTCGFAGGCGPSQPAGDGLLLESGFVLASGCSFIGGAGVNGIDCGPFAMGARGSDGGDGARLASSGAELLSLDTTFVGGGAGSGCGAAAVAGVALDLGPGLFTPLAGSARSLSVSSPVAEGLPVSFDFQGEPFDLVIAGVSTGAEQVYLAALSGVLLVDPSALVIVPLGAANAAGSLTATLPAASLVGPGEVEIWRIQGVWLPLAGGALLGPAASLVVHE